MACPTCGAPVPPGAKFCDTCGVELLPATPRSDVVLATPYACPYCKTPNRAGAMFCTNCGIRIKPESRPPLRDTDAYTAFAQDYWLYRSILAAIVGIVFLLIALAINQLVLAGIFGLVAVAGFAGTLFVMKRRP